MSKKTDLFYIYKFNSKFLIDKALGKDIGGTYITTIIYSPYIFYFLYF